MLLDRQSVENLVALRDERESPADDLMGVAPRPLAARAPDLKSVEQDRTALPAGEPRYCLEERRLAMPVEANEPDALAREHDEIEIMNHPQRSPAG
jgi:hypothetical protein